LLSALALATALWGATEVGFPVVGVRAETRAGLVPVSPEVASQGALDLELKPNLGLRLDNRALHLQLLYEPRILARVPNQLGQVLVFHSAMMEHALRLDDQDQWTSSVAFGTGDIDYGAAAFLFGGGTASSLPDSAIVGYTEIRGQSQLAVQASRRVRLQTTARGSFNQPNQGNEGLFEETGRVGGMFETIVSLDRRTRLVPSFDGEWVGFGGGSSYFYVAPMLGVRRQLNHRTEAGLSLGTSITVSNQNDPQVYPVGMLDTVVRVVRDDAVGVDARAAVGAEMFADPVRATLEPRIVGTLASTVNIPNNWSAGIVGRFATNPENNPTPAFQEYDTVIAVDVPVRYQFEPNLAVEFGGRFSARAPHLSASDFGFNSILFVGYVAFEARFNATPGASRNLF
jgi:hypothetical protein